MYLYNISDTWSLWGKPKQAAHNWFMVHRPHMNNSVCQPKQIHRHGLKVHTQLMSCLCHEQTYCSCMMFYLHQPLCLTGWKPAFTVCHCTPNGTVASSIYLLPPATTLPQLKKLQSTCIIILWAHVFRVHVCPGFTLSKSLNIWVCLWGWGWGGGTLLLGKATIKHRFHLHLTGRQTDQLTDSF